MGVEKIKTVLLLASCLVILLGCGSSTSKQKAEDIRIGLLIDGGTPGGEPSLRAAKLIIQQVNAAGGLLIGAQRHQVVLEIRDTGNNPTTAMEVARDLVHRAGVVAIVGPNVSRNAIPAANVAQHAGIPMISPGSTNPETTRNKDHVFRAAFVDTYQGCIMARFAIEDLGARRAAVLFDIANSSNRDVARVFQAVFTADGGQMTDVLNYTTGETDFSEAMAQIKEHKPDVLLLPNYSKDVLLQARQAQEAGIQAVLLGCDGWSPTKVSGEPALVGAYFNQHWHPDAAKTNPKSAAFLEAFRQSFNTDPVNMAALTADSLGMLFQVMTRKSSLDAGDIRQGLSSLQDYEGITGPISYDDHGDPQKGTVILSIHEDGVSVFKQQKSDCPVDLNL